MKKIAVITGVLCAISSGTFAQQTVVFIPAFDSRFASIHEPVVALNTINSSAAFQARTFGVMPTTDPAARGVVSSPAASAIRPTLDPTVMNIPVFPGNTVLVQQQSALGVGTVGVNTVPINTGFGGSGFFFQQGGNSSLVPIDPFRTTATPGPAVNAVPNPAAPTPTIPQLQVSPNPTIPVRQQNPMVLVPAVPVIQGTPSSSVQGSSGTSQGTSQGTASGSANRAATGTATGGGAKR